jgi:AcrR family transcriptional regulator
LDGEHYLGQDDIRDDQEPKTVTSTSTPAAKNTKATRRPRGEPRRLLLDAARELFARQDYRATTTREIAEAAGVAEHLLFRHFGSKAALFREALVVPVTSFIDNFSDTWRSVVPEGADGDEVARQFVGQLYDLFVEHRGLVITLWASEALSEEELAEAGIADIDRALALLGQIGAEGLGRKGVRLSHHDLAARSTVAMIAGMAAFRSTFFGGTRPPREFIVDELTQTMLHGVLHREHRRPLNSDHPR